MAWRYQWDREGILGKRAPWYLHGDDGETDRHWHDASGHLHRDGGPAIERSDGTKSWYRHGWLVRDDPPWPPGWHHPPKEGT